MYQNNFLCNWKLLADVCHNVAQLPQKYCFLNVVPTLIQSESEENVKITLREILLLSVRYGSNKYRLHIEITNKNFIMFFCLDI